MLATELVVGALVVLALVVGTLMMLEVAGGVDVDWTVCSTYRMRQYSAPPWTAWSGYPRDILATNPDQYCDCRIWQMERGARR